MMVSHSTIFVTGFTAVRLKRTEPSGPVCEVPVYSSIWIRRSCASGLPRPRAAPASADDGWRASGCGCGCGARRRQTVMTGSSSSFSSARR